MQWPNGKPELGTLIFSLMSNSPHVLGPGSEGNPIKSMNKCECIERVENKKMFLLRIKKEKKNLF